MSKNIKPITLAKKLWPLNRSITGKGNVQSLKILQKVCRNIKIKKYKSGKKVYDWTIPQVWNLREAYIKDPSGRKICDFKKNNLHVVGYSISINKILNLKDLNKNLYSRKNFPKAIPYVTSYYKKNWGFCLSHDQRKKLKEGKYQAIIKSNFFKGYMHYGECFIKGKYKKEVFLSTYICHPSMANNEISGPVIVSLLAEWLRKKKNLKYSYRIVFVPETIGSIAYIFHNKNNLKKNIIAGYNVTCVGDDRKWSLLPSKKANSLSDRIAFRILKKEKIKFKLYDWLSRGSDERQYCSPGIDLPVCSVMRSKYETYPEYHTSLDKIGTVISNKGLNNSLNLYKKIINEIEESVFPTTSNFCEPKLSKKNLYPATKNSISKHLGRKILDFITFCDGETTLKEISDKIKLNKTDSNYILNLLKKNHLIKIKNTPTKV